MDIQQSFLSKISRERVGIELRKMLRNTNADRALELITRVDGPGFDIFLPVFLPGLAKERIKAQLGDFKSQSDLGATAYSERTNAPLTSEIAMKLAKEDSKF